MESQSENPDFTESEPKREKKSIVHQYFELRDDKFQCKICRKLYARDKTGSTGGLLRHLTSKHSSMIPHDGEETRPNKFKQPPLTGQRLDMFTREGFKKRLMNLIIQKDLPFSLVDDAIFRELLAYCNPDATTPSDTTFRRQLDDLYEEKKTELKLALANAPGKLSFVIDCWTSPNQKAFQGVIVTFIDSNWELRHILLDVTPLQGTHSGANLCQSFTALLEEFQIQHKLLAVTMDNASNMNSFCNKLEEYCNGLNIAFDQNDMRVRCLAHIINLACKDAINSLLEVAVEETVSSQGSETFDANGSEDEEIDEIGTPKTNKILILKLRKGIVKIRSSPQRQSAYLRQCQAAGLKQNMLIEDVSTRWNSTYMMIKRAINMKIAYNSTLYADSNLKQYALTEEEWETLKGMLDFLEPFKSLTATMMDGKFPTIAVCGLVYLDIFQHVESYMPTKTPEANNYPFWLQNAANLAYQKLDKYYPTTDGAVYIIGSVLDPRLKLEWHKQNFPTDVVSKFRSCLKKKWESQYKPSSASLSADTSDNQSKIPDVFERHMSKRVRIETRDELATYLSEKIINPALLTESGPLEWWKCRQTDYPNLSKMARDYLPVAGTGVSIERFFSFGKLLLDDNRMSMSEQTAQKCLSLKIWLKTLNNPDFTTDVNHSVIEKILA